MTLYIVTKNSTEVKPVIKAICSKVGLVNYFILDPKYNEVDRPYRYVLFLEEEPAKVTAFKKWFIPLRLSTSLALEDKKKVMQAFGAIKDVMESTYVKETIPSSDLPDPKDLPYFLNEFKGSFLQMTLPDRRSIGVYPDGQKLLGQCDVEYHVSALVNMLKIKELFNPTEISIKEI